MAKITAGDHIPDFHFSTPFRSDVILSEAVAENMTALIFLRYYGCPLCQFDMTSYAESYDRVLAAGGKLFIVLQSDPQQLSQELGSETAFPFEIICDPQQELYHQFAINPAASKAKMIGPKTLVKIARVQAGGYKHGRSEGEELQLPAVFVMTPDLLVTYAHYGKTVDDVPGTDELPGLLKYTDKEKKQ
jgi:peroxiredoxin